MADVKKEFRVKSGGYDFEFDSTDIQSKDIVRRADDELHILHNNRSVTVRLLDTDVTGKKMKLEVDGERFEVEINDSLDLMLEQMGYSAASSKHIKEIKAPMPGMVINVAVKEGQQVKEGDRILILEAMKMENSIIIHADAVIKRVAVNAGQAVDKGQVLVELE
jgi:biotin carboxyl carrier protein